MPITLPGTCSSVTTSMTDTLLYSSDWRKLSRVLGSFWFRSPAPEVPMMARQLDALDEPGYPAYTTGRPG